jgi:hypothetical protein
MYNTRSAQRLQDLAMKSQRYGSSTVTPTVETCGHMTELHARKHQPALYPNFLVLTRPLTVNRQIERTTPSSTNVDRSQRERVLTKLRVPNWLAPPLALPIARLP